MRVGRYLDYMNNHQSPHRAANELLLDERYLLFKREILNRLDANPEAYVDASLEVNVVAGRIQHAHATTKQNGVKVTDRFKVKGHIPVPAR